MKTINYQESGKVKQESIQVLIADDIPQVRQGLSTMLKLATKNTSPNIEIIGEAENGNIAIQKAQSLRPNAILMDLEMPVVDGYTATQVIKKYDPSIFIIILTIHDDSETRQKAAQAGADAFISKSSPPDSLVHSLINLRKVDFRQEIL